VRVLVFGAGVIGSVYAGGLLQAGHDVVLLARGTRLRSLQTRGLILAEAGSGSRTALSVTAVSEPTPGDHFDLVLVALRAEQLPAAVPVLTDMTDGSDVLFLGNTGGYEAELRAALGGRALFGFPGAGGFLDAATVNYVLIRQQKTMLGEPDGRTTPRTSRLKGVFEGAGFPTLVSADMGAWLLGHLAFVVPVAFSLYRAGTSPKRLAGDSATMRLMVRSTREAFRALRGAGNHEIPPNLKALYRLPTVLVVAYWRRVLNGPRGELWFAAHTRAAPEEMRSLARALQLATRATGGRTPHLDRLLTSPQ
jgi:2-dehydropantoate 2-reductase